MSALAARRAAGTPSTSLIPASQSSASPVPGPTNSNPKSHPARPPVKTPQKRAPRSSTGDFHEPNNPASSSSKRRRVEKSPPSKQRYFVEPQQVGFKGKQRAFSPGAPVASDEEDDDSSAGESDVEDVEDEAAGDVDEGRVRWDMGVSAPSTPRHTQMEAGPSRAEVGSSRFTVREGVNMVKVSEEELRRAGYRGEGLGVVLGLAAEESLLIAGIYTLTVLQGSVRIASRTLSASSTSYQVFAPTSHPIPTIEPVPKPSPSRNASLDRLTLPSGFLSREGKAERAVILICESCTGLEGLRNGVIPGFSHTWMSESGPWGLRNIHAVVDSFSTPVYPYITPSSWTDALGSLIPQKEEEDVLPTVVLVKGPKRTGKSTLARAAMNELLGSYRQVAWLECDLGQGEFGPGGMVGLWIVGQPLFGPPFSHPRSPHRANYLGTYTPLTCPDEYIAAIRHLLEVYKYEIQYPLPNRGQSSAQSDTRRSDVAPLVVNTQGWVKGLGEDLLRGIEAAAEPSHIFAFEQPAYNGLEEEGSHASAYDPPIYPDQGGPISSAKVFVLEAAPASPLQARYTSADMRILSMITYLHADFGNATWDLRDPLPAMAPLEVSLGPKGPLREVFLIGEGSEGIIVEDLHLALNGAIVGLGRNDNPSEDVYIPGRQLPSLDDTNIYGLGLIRGIVQTDEGYILRLLSPLSSNELGRVNCILRNGAIELPLCGLVDWREKLGERGDGKMWGMDLADVPFLQRGGGGGVGVERKRVRRNLQRRNV